MASVSLRLLGSVFALVVIGADASAQPPLPEPASPAISTVTVTAKRASQSDVVRSVMVPFVDLHAARDPKTGLMLRAAPSGVCPITLGLSDPYSQFVTARIAAVARSVGVTVRKIGKCQPNIEVLFSDDPQSLVDDLAKRSWGGILGFHHVQDERSLAHMSRPIQAWYKTGTLSDSGASDPAGDQDGLHSSIPMQAVVDQDDGSSPRSGTGSRIPPPNSGQILNVMIVVDTGKLDGQEIGPIADYAAMLALSQAKGLDHCGKLPSILDLLATDCASDTKAQALTEGDLAFLRALYATNIKGSATDARNIIARGMARDLRDAKPAQ